MNIRTLLIRACLCLALAFANESVVAAPEDTSKSAKAESPIKPGMKVKIMYAASFYPGVLVRIEGSNYIVRDDNTGKEYGYALDRMYDANGIPFAELLGTPQVRAAAAQERKQGLDFFVGIWTTSSQGVWNTVDSKRNSDGSTTEKKRFEGTGSGGWLRIKADNTWTHRMFGAVMSGAWKVSEDKARPGIVLIKGNITDDDLYVQRRPKGELFLQRAAGGAGHVATIVPPETPAPDKS